MPVPVRRLALGLLLGGALLTGGASSAPVAAQSCDPAYTSHCVSPVWEVGDLNCQYFYDQGIYGIVLADPSNDPHGLDGWNYVDDGYGCEGDYEGDTTELSGTQGIVTPADDGVAPAYEEPVPITSDCDPSYPDLCISPGPPDLDCGEVGAGYFTVLPPDPHGFDGDGNGVGCES